MLTSAVDWIIFLLECFAIASFAISGTISAINKRADVFGALIFAFVTSFGGGLMRDLIIGRTPPLLFTSKEYAVLAAICFAVSLTVFLAAFIGNAAESLNAHAHSWLMEGSDMVGLAFFCILGVDSVLNFPPVSGNAMLVIFCGCITGIGGGILRDVLSAQIPLLFRKRIYFIPALLGTVCYYVLLSRIPRLAAILISVTVILVLRILAVRFRWNLPTPLGRPHETTQPEKEEKEKRS